MPMFASRGAYVGKPLHIEFDEVDEVGLGHAVRCSQPLLRRHWHGMYADAHSSPINGSYRDFKSHQQTAEMESGEDVALFKFAGLQATRYLARDFLQKPVAGGKTLAEGLHEALKSLIPFDPRRLFRAIW